MGIVKVQSAAFGGGSAHYIVVQAKEYVGFGTGAAYRGGSIDPSIIERRTPALAFRDAVAEEVGIEEIWARLTVRPEVVVVASASSDVEWRLGLRATFLEAVAPYVDHPRPELRIYRPDSVPDDARAGEQLR